MFVVAIDGIVEGETGALAGRVVVVTGGGGTAGRAVAHALAVAGAGVAVVGRADGELAETAVLIERAGRRVLPVPANVTNGRDVARMAAEIERRLGPVDVLVNHAGPPRLAGPTWETDPRRWWGAVKVNVRGAFLCARAVLPGMLARRRGVILNVAYCAPAADGAALDCSAAALVGLSGTLARETAGRGVHVFAVLLSGGEADEAGASTGLPTDLGNLAAALVAGKGAALGGHVFRARVAFPLEREAAPEDRAPREAAWG